MNTRTARIAGVAVLAIAAMAAFAQPATRTPIQAAPSYVPVGVASSGNATTAWFHNPSSGSVLACHAGAVSGGSPAPIQCVSAKLP
jgi:hypothetical protein